MTADTREVLLATIPERLLLHDDQPLLDWEDNDRLISSIAAHALDAALARGATPEEIYEVVAAEYGRLASGDSFDLATPILDPSLDRYAEPIENLGPEEPPLLQGRTISGARRLIITTAIFGLADALHIQAAERVGDAAARRVAEQGLPEATTAIGEVLTHREQVALFTAGLYEKHEVIDDDA